MPRRLGFAGEAGQFSQPNVNVRRPFARWKSRAQPSSDCPLHALDIRVRARHTVIGEGERPGYSVLDARRVQRIDDGLNSSGNDISNSLGSWLPFRIAGDHGKTRLLSCLSC